VGAGSKVILNGQEMHGIKAISLDINANSMMDARVLIRVNELHLDNCELDVLLEAVDAQVRNDV
jgi:hypothetical protein